MSLLGKLTKFGLAKKALDEARKPENQERIKRMAASVANRGKRKTDGTPAASAGATAQAPGGPAAGTREVSAAPPPGPAAAPAEAPPPATP